MERMHLLRGDRSDLVAEIPREGVGEAPPQPRLHGQEAVDEVGPAGCTARWRLCERHWLIHCTMRSLHG